MESSCRREIVELHRFFQDWFNGALPDSDDPGVARLTAALAEGFQLISPQGELHDRAAVIEQVRRAHGRWRASGAAGAAGTTEKAEKATIRIENARVRHLAGDLALVTYEEWQQVDGASRGRLSSAWFRRNESAPAGVEWLHLHEVWLPQR